MNEKQRLLLGLSKNELKVVESLFTSPKLVADIARNIKLPKTTINYIVLKLKKRGLIFALPYGKRHSWSLVDNFNLVESFTSLAQLFIKDGHTDIKTISISKNTRIQLYRGTKSLYKLWLIMSSLPRLERLYAIQPDSSFNLALNHFLKHFSYDEINEINHRIKKNKIIIEAIVHEQSAETIPKTIAAKGYHPTQFLDGFKDRLADTVKLPEGFMDVGTEMYMFNKTLVIIQWNNELGISITNPDIVTFYKGMFESLKFLSKKYNQNERIAQKNIELSKLK